MELLIGLLELFADHLRFFDLLLELGRLTLQLLSVRRKRRFGRDSIGNVAQDAGENMAAG
ncbi:MAG: hypothetical protein ABIQ10_01790 [Gemmatimonadaceae bacterium]